MVTVSDVEVIGGGSDILVVNWTVPSQCLGGQYEVNYRLIRREACPEEELQDSEVKTVWTNNTNIQITDLEALATYAITISKTGDTGSSISISGTTLSSGRLEGLIEITISQLPFANQFYKILFPVNR